MRRIIALILSVSVICSFLPVISFAEKSYAEEPYAGPENKSTYGLKENPLVFTKDTKFLTYEVEDYPVESYNYRRNADPLASGGACLQMATGINYEGKTVGNTQVPGDIIPYKLYIKADQYTKIKIFVRAKAGDDQKSRFRCSSNSARTVQRTQYVLEGPEQWGWVLCDNYELTPGEVMAFNFQFVGSGHCFDKFFITTDTLFTPSGMGEEFHEVKLGEDTTPYEYFKYPIPPFTPKKSRPRVYTDEVRLEEIKATLDHPENKPRYEQVLKHASTPPADYSYTKAGPYIWCNAFLNLINDDPEASRKAIDALFKFLRGQSGMQEDRISKSSGNERIIVLNAMAIVYDWCNDELTDDEKLELIGFMIYFGGQLEHPYPTYGTIGRLNGHESEGDIFSGLLSCAISIYEDFPEMYNVVGGLIFEEMLSTRNVFYDNRHHTQGAHYKGGRLACEIQLITLMEYGVSKGLFSGEPDECLMDYVLSLRPDGDVFKNGDTGRSSGKNVFSTSLQALFGFGNHFNNPYLKDLWFTSAPNPPFGYNYGGLSDVKFLLMNDPSVERKSYKELPLTVINKEGGIMWARTSWDKGDNEISNQMQVRLNLETFTTGGHDHLDVGHFDIYYKGMLALDSGHYGTEPYVDANGEIESRAGMGSLHQGTWYARTIAHNCMLLYDPTETWNRWSTAKVNEGGQLNRDSSGGTLKEYVEGGKTSEILAADYGEDMYAPSFSYMKGDLTSAYSSNKMEKYTRSFVFLNFFDDVYPGALIVFDRMVSKNPEFKKTWLLHTQQEPIVNGNTTIADKTEEGDNGRLINTTLYPKLEDIELTTIGGPGKEFWHSGWNWYAVHKNESKDYGEWRLEISPKNPSAEDCFLNVLHVTDATGNIEPLQAELVEAGNFVGAKIKDRVAFFLTDEGRYNGEINFELTGNENYEILFTDVHEGQWIVYKDGVEYQRVVATTNGGDFNFKGTAGKYRIVRNKRSDATFTRDIEYRNHTKDLGSDYTYFTFNGVTTDIPYLVEENDVLYVDALKLAYISNGRAEILEDKIRFYGYKDKILDVPLDSESIKLVDGIYYINQETLKDLYFLKYSVYRGFIYALKGGIETKEVTYEREDGMAYIIGIEQDEDSYSPEYPSAYAIDKEIETFWQIELVGGNITLELDRTYTLSEVEISWSKNRGHDMKIETSEDGVNWTTVYDDMTDVYEVSKGYQNIKFNQTVKAKYVRVTGRGNTSNGTWFAVREIRFPVSYEEWQASIDAERDAEKETTEEDVDISTDDELTEEELLELENQ